MLLTTQDPAAVPSIASRLDGVIFSGGGDIVPDVYGAADHETLYGLEPARDTFEFALVREVRQRKLPTLAICRGMQVTNVALGGTLIVDILSELPGAHDHFLSGDAVYETRITVTLDTDSRLARLLGEHRFDVNSIHHQAVLDLAPGLRAVGWGDDGVVEALEHEDDDWPFAAVQWHPEYLSEKGDVYALRLFESLVEAAAR